MMRKKAALHSVLVMAALAVMGVAVVTASPALAARGGKNGVGGGSSNGGSGGAASIRLDQSDPHLGDWVTFTTSGGSLVNVACYQGGLNLVYAAAQPTGSAFLLGGPSSDWLSNGGDAICWAWLYGKNTKQGFLASTSFIAGGAR